MNQACSLTSCTSMKVEPKMLVLIMLKAEVNRYDVNRIAILNPKLNDITMRHYPINSVWVKIDVISHEKSSYLGSLSIH